MKALQAALLIACIAVAIARLTVHPAPYINVRGASTAPAPIGNPAVSTPVPFGAVGPQVTPRADGYIIVINPELQADYLSTEPAGSYSNGYKLDWTAIAQGDYSGVLTNAAQPGFDPNNYMDPGVSAQTAAQWCAQYAYPYEWRYEPPDRCYWQQNPGEWVSVPVHAMWLYTPRPGE